MINLGTHNLDHWPDDWTAVTTDGRKSAQFEETILCVTAAGESKLIFRITETGFEVLTRHNVTKFD